MDGIKQPRVNKRPEDTLTNTLSDMLEDVKNKLHPGRRFAKVSYECIQPIKLIQHPSGNKEE